MLSILYEIHGSFYSIAIPISATLSFVSLSGLFPLPVVSPAEVSVHDSSLFHLLHHRIPDPFPGETSPVFINAVGNILKENKEH